MAAAALVLAAMLEIPAQAGTADTRLDPRRAIERSEAAVGNTVGNYVLIDTTGNPLSLLAYRGAPLIVSLVYSSCSSVCPATTQHLIATVSEARRVFGADAFAVLTVGFDARNDSPAHMARFAIVQGVHFDNWRIASADAATLTALLRDLGFSYVTVAGGFDHVTQTTVIDRNGKIYRQVYGDDFPMQMLIEPLKDTIYGTAARLTFAGLIDRIRFICTTYDPGGGRYRIDYGLMFGSVIAGLSLVLLGGLIMREWRRAPRA